MHTITSFLILREPLLPELLHHSMSPFCRKVRVVLDEKGFSFTLRAENVMQKREAFLALNPAGLVPVLIEEDGRAFADSRAIVEYLQDVRAEPDMFGATPTDRAETRRLVAWFDEKMYAEVTRNIVEEKIFKWRQQRGQPDSKVLAAALADLRIHLRYIEHLVNRRFWLAGEKFGLADIAAATQVSCIDYVGDISWSAWSSAREWYARVKSRPSFRPILEDRIAGMPPAKHYADPDF